MNLLKGFKFVFDNLKNVELSYDLLFAVVFCCVLFTIYKNFFSFEKKIKDIINGKS
jgi:hypothetical protein